MGLYNPGFPTRNPSFVERRFITLGRFDVLRRRPELQFGTCRATRGNASRTLSRCVGQPSVLTSISDQRERGVYIRAGARIASPASDRRVGWRIVKSKRRLVCLQRPADFAAYRLRLLYANDQRGAVPKDALLPAALMKFSRRRSRRHPELCSPGFLRERGSFADSDQRERFIRSRAEARTACPASDRAEARIASPASDREPGVRLRTDKKTKNERAERLPRFSRKRNQWAHMDSDHGPQPYQGCALTKLSYAPDASLVQTTWVF